MGIIKKEKLVGLSDCIWGEKKEESRTTIGESLGRKEGDSSVWDAWGVRYGWAYKPEGSYTFGINMWYEDGTNEAARAEGVILSSRLRMES